MKNNTVLETTEKFEKINVRLNNIKKDLTNVLNYMTRMTEAFKETDTIHYK